MFWCFLLFVSLFGVGFVSVLFALLLVLWLDVVVFVFFVFFVGFLFFGGFKGQVRWPEGPPHLALNPPCFVFVFVFCFCFFVFFWFSCFLLFYLFVLFVLFLFFGGFKGQVRWPKGPPHLALNPLFFVFCFLFVCFLFLLSFLCA